MRSTLARAFAVLVAFAVFAIAMPAVAAPHHYGKSQPKAQTHKAPKAHAAHKHHGKTAKHKSASKPKAKTVKPAPKPHHAAPAKKKH